MGSSERRLRLLPPRQTQLYSVSCTPPRCEPERTSCHWVMFAVSSIATSKFFHDLVGTEIDRMRRSWNMEISIFSCLRSPIVVPAPTMTLLTPRHNVRSPSSRYIVETAFEMPVYSPPDVGLMICIRVYCCRSVTDICIGGMTLAYLHQINRIHHRVLLSRTSVIAALSEQSLAYRNTREGTCQHVVSQAIVCWKSFIAIEASAMWFCLFGWSGCGDSLVIFSRYGVRTARYCHSICGQRRREVRWARHDCGADRSICGPPQEWVVTMGASLKEMPTLCLRNNRI
jgi:hypothetical protein